MRGDLHELKSPRSGTGTSTRPTDFRPEITLLGEPTHVLVEQTVAVDPTRLGKLVGHTTLREMQGIDSALRTVFGL